MSTTTDLKAGSNLEKMFAAGHFAVTGECGPPKSADFEIVAGRGVTLERVEGRDEEPG